MNSLYILTGVALLTIPQVSEACGAGYYSDFLLYSTVFALSALLIVGFLIRQRKKNGGSHKTLTGLGFFIIALYIASVSYPYYSSYKINLQIEACLSSCTENEICFCNPLC